MVTDWGGKREEHDAIRLARGSKMVKLPFNYCNLGLTAAEDTFCTVEENTSAKIGEIQHYGAIYDLLNVIPFIKKHGKNPVTG